MSDYAKINDCIYEVRCRDKVTSSAISARIDDLEVQRRQLHEKVDEQFDRLVLDAREDLLKVETLEKQLDKHP